MARPKPRAALYALGEAASRSIGGSTSRVGADLSIPITPTASFYSTFHPDYSNVELDQQSISPTVYQRYYSEVRPFFTQAASFYNQFNCNACQNIQSLYTPAIPTPAEGYAVEGKQGPFGFASFDSIGDNRNDLATAIDYTSQNAMWNSSVQRVSVDMPGFIDTTTEGGVAYSDLKHINAYLNYGNDSGTNVFVPNQAQYYEIGGGWANQTFGFFGATRKIGEYYDPTDGFISHPGIAGYALYAAKIWDFNGNDKLASVGHLRGSSIVIRDRSSDRRRATTRSRRHPHEESARPADFQRIELLAFRRPVDADTQNGGFQFTYDSGLQTNNPGNFPYHGHVLDADDDLVQHRTLRKRAARHVVSLDDDTNRQSRCTYARARRYRAMASRAGSKQRSMVRELSYAYQIGRNSSFAIGIRRVVGDPPIPNGGGDCIGACSNVSVAYHLRARNSEVYSPTAIRTR